jgi:acetyl esterase
MEQNFNNEIPVGERHDGPGVSHIDPNDPAAPAYRLLARLRSPLTLREMMIEPVRKGYIGDHPIDPKELPLTAAELYPDIAVSEILIPSPAGPVCCDVYTPPGKANARPLVLYLHGGGFTIGRATDTAYITSRIAKENGAIVVSADYRLAPEWPFPAGLDDAIACLRWLREHAGSLGGDPARIAIAGDSAGGNMAAALPLRARDEGLKPPEAAILLCPLTDFFFEKYPSFDRLAPLGIVYDMAFAGFIRGAYAVHYNLWSHPHVSPMLGDLKGYPPALIVSGGHDPVIDENTAFAARLRAAGNGFVEHFVRQGMPHGYYFFPGIFREGDEAFAAVQRLITAVFNPALSSPAERVS